MGSLQVLVETVSLGNELLLPLAEPLLLDLDLLGEPLAQGLLLFLELGVVQLARSRFTELPRLHLLSTVVLVVLLLSRLDEVKHVSPDEKRSDLLEVAVVLVLNFSNSPDVLAALDHLALVVLHVFLRADDGKRHGGDQATGMRSGMLIVLVDGRLIDLDSLGLHDSPDLFL